MRNKSESLILTSLEAIWKRVFRDKVRWEPADIHVAVEVWEITWTNGIRFNYIKGNSSFDSLLSSQTI